MSKWYTKEQAREIEQLYADGHGGAINAFGGDLYKRGFLIGGFGVLGGMSAMLGVFKLVELVVNETRNHNIKKLKE